ncbi:MAG: YqgE/AlgH family protein [Verrucomicrobiales bacterium]
MESSPFDNPGPLCLRGSVILADPSLRDPNFARTVLLLTEHQVEFGAHGYVLNRPLGKKVGALLTGSQFQTLAQVPVFLGGPVSQEKLTFALLKWDAESGKLNYTTHLAVDDAKELHHEGGSIRAFLGYAGWAEGQLENELRQHAWITRKAGPAIVEMKEPDKLWSELLSSMGPWYGLLARMPEDPSLN